ncbi:MAG: transporter substrate-binding domain-containing protein [Clostridia bacterium]|nr:transporter substrate-binding domain-containing protein [Clostridia bacterium]
MNTKKLLCLIMALLSATMLLAACGGEEKSDDVVLVAYTQSAYPPFAYLDDKDVFQGFDPEVMRELDKRLDGYTIDIQTLPWDSQFASIESGKGDMICNQVAITEGRLEKYTMTIPYFLASPSIIVAADTNDIESLEDLHGKTVWAQVGDSYTTFLEEYNAENGDPIKLHYVENQMLADALMDLQIGKFDAIINDPVMANTVIKEKNLNCKVTGEPVFTEAIGIILQKNEKGEELKEKFDAIIEEMKKDGTLSKLSTEITGGDYIPE